MYSRTGLSHWISEREVFPSFFLHYSRSDIDLHRIMPVYYNGNANGIIISQIHTDYDPTEHLLEDYFIYLLY